MLDLRNAKRIAIIGGGTAGWFAALNMRAMFSPAAEVTVIEAPDIGIIGVGEGGLVNIVHSLRSLNIDIGEFTRETGAAFKLGFLYEGWRGGSKEDFFYHLFGEPGTPELEWRQNSFYPMLALRVANGVDLHSALRGYEAISKNASQAETVEILARQKAEPPSFHFDSHKVATFLRSVAEKRGVVHRSAKVKELLLAENGNVRALALDSGELEVDFLVDASGFARLGIGKTYKSRWKSFSDTLILDRAIPFHLKHTTKNPPLFTRATAMNSGWLWRIPLIERLGAGYVFSSKHMTEEEGVREVEALLGHKIEPQRTLKFEPGHFDRVWIGNVVALGLASGFVEPLEATSIGQMLEQLRNLRRTLRDCGGIVPAQVIVQFNHDNARSWMEIRDFLRMHYDGGRNDTPFWRDVAASPYPATYAELKRCFKERSPRSTDLDVYVGRSWGGIFHPLNWLMVGAPLGVVSRQAAWNEISTLDNEAKERLAAYAQNLQRSMQAAGALA